MFVYTVVDFTMEELERELEAELEEEIIIERPPVSEPHHL